MIKKKTMLLRIKIDIYDNARYYFDKFVYRYRGAAVNLRQAVNTTTSKMACLLVLMPSIATALDQPSLDTLLKPGAPLYARLQLPEKLLRDRSGYLRLPDREEVTSQGLTWNPLQASLELVPKIGAPENFYLTSREPVPSGVVEVSLVWESADKQILLPFRAARWGGATQVEALPQRDLSLLSSSDRVSGRGSEPTEQAVATGPATTSSDLTRVKLPAPAPTKPSEPTKEVSPSSITNDRLSEKLKNLLAEGERRPSRPVSEKNVPSNNLVDDTRIPNTGAQLDNPAGGRLPADVISTQVAENSSESARSMSSGSTNVRSPESTSAGTLGGDLSGNSPTANKVTSPLLGWQLSLLDVLLLLVLGWLVVISRYAVSVRAGLTDLVSGATIKTPLKDASATTDPTNNASRKTMASGSTASSSVLANVLRQAAAQAEEADIWETQSQVDIRRAKLAAQQQQALFQCASQLQDIRAGASTTQVASGYPDEMPPSQVSQHGDSGKQGLQQQPLRPDDDQKKADSVADAGSTTAAPHRSPSTPRQVKKASPFVGEGSKKPTPKQEGTFLGPGQVLGVGGTANKSAEATDKQLEAQYGEQLSLASVYLNMGEVDTARSLLEDVLKNGSVQDQIEAQKIMREIEND